METYTNHQVNRAIGVNYLDPVNSKGTSQQLEETLSFIKPWLQLTEKIKDKEDQAIFLNNLGILLQKSNRQNEAEKAFRLCQTICEQLNKPHELAKALNNLASLLKKQKRWSEAEKVLRQHFDSLIMLQNLKGQAIILNNLAQVLEKQGEKEKFNFALVCFKKSIDIGIQIKAQRHLATVYSAMGSALLKRGYTKEAIIQLTEAFKIEEVSKNNRGLEIITPSLVENLKKLGQHQEAVAYCRRALAITPNSSILLKLL